MTLPEGTYGIVKPPSWRDLLAAIDSEASDDIGGPQVRGVELGPSEEDALAARRKALGGSAYRGATMDFRILFRAYPPVGPFVVAEGPQGTARFEPSNPDDSSQPATAHFVPHTPGSMPEDWQQSVHITK